MEIMWASNIFDFFRKKELKKMLNFVRFEYSDSERSIES